MFGNLVYYKTTTGIAGTDRKLTFLNDNLCLDRGQCCERACQYLIKESHTSPTEAHEG